MSKRNRDKKQARRSPSREVKPVILVVTEGENTEPQYIEGLANYQKNPRVKVEVSGGEGTPKTLVQRAKELKLKNEQESKRQKNTLLKFDEIWCVFDIDEHPYIPDAVKMACDNNFKLAISNPCIEIWLWLHFADSPGARHRHDLQAMLKQNYLPDYDKSIDFADFVDGYKDAMGRAERLEHCANEEGEDSYQCYKVNPTTGMWHLLESICGKDEDEQEESEK